MKAVSSVALHDAALDDPASEGFLDLFDGLAFAALAPASAVRALRMRATRSLVSGGAGEGPGSRVGEGGDTSGEAATLEGAGKSEDVAVAGKGVRPVTH